MALIVVHAEMPVAVEYSSWVVDLGVSFGSRCCGVMSCYTRGYVVRQLLVTVSRHF